MGEEFTDTAMTFLAAGKLSKCRVLLKAAAHTALNGANFALCILLSTPSSWR